MALLSDSEIDIHLVFMIMRDFIIGREPEPELTQVIIDNYVAYTSRGNLILVDNIDILIIHDYISDQLINNNIIMSSDIPLWLITSHRKELRDLYISLTGRIELCEEDIHLYDNVVMTNKNLLINNIVYPLTTAFIKRKTITMKISGLNPIKITLLGNREKKILTRPTLLYHKNSRFLGEFINLNGVLLSALASILKLEVRTLKTSVLKIFRKILQSQANTRS